MNTNLAGLGTGTEEDSTLDLKTDARLELDSVVPSDG